ncbi:helix-turn-helix domain-containing protein [Clostridium chromiireducens]|uniref:Helix-turn-helix domain-containing protein n=1 Tax=Clostridium chromiireducens TaxID=225345 RepID=A0A964RK91_9CLOT|nr:helix-turn-helix transcriptional regulator [Clostridium chromiireducens]MVX63101.1 helix-turn-helix domain-containing protein [Clostridium chromiireducens]
MKIKDTDIIDYKVIGSRIKQKRLEKGHTQESLSEKLSISNEYVSKIETGAIKINLKRLAEISVILETPLEYFIVGTIIRGEDYKTNEFIRVFDSLTSAERDFICNIAEQIKSLRIK